MKISNAKVIQIQLPLVKPYVLSFATLTDFRSCFMIIETDTDNVGIGEATALTGYAAETHEEIYRVLEEAAPKLVGLAIDDARMIVDMMFMKWPFAASAIGTALDFAYNMVQVPDVITCPLLSPVSSNLSKDSLLKEIEHAANSGIRTIKVKIGQDIENDLLTVRTLAESQFNVLYRFDANQGYSFNDAVLFLEELEKNIANKVELMEQPFLPEKWDNMEHLCKISQIPLMLDESIFNKDDISRAKDIGASFIKLKLFKTKGVMDLIERAMFAHSLGLKVVLGNGVATDVANLAEAIAFSTNSDIFHGAFEGNGFAKTKSLLLKNSLMLLDGNAVWKIKQPIFDTVLF